jgi:hypothetical protein
MSAADYSNRKPQNHSNSTSRRNTIEQFRRKQETKEAVQEAKKRKKQKQQTNQTPAAVIALKEAKEIKPQATSLEVVIGGKSVQSFPAAVAKDLDVVGNTTVLAFTASLQKKQQKVQKNQQEQKAPKQLTTSSDSSSANEEEDDEKEAASWPQLKPAPQVSLPQNSAWKKGMPMAKSKPNAQTTSAPDAVVNALVNAALPLPSLPLSSPPSELPTLPQPPDASTKKAVDVDFTDTFESFLPSHRCECEKENKRLQTEVDLLRQELKALNDKLPELMQKSLMNVFPLWATMNNLNNSYHQQINAVPLSAPQTYQHQQMDSSFVF